MNSSEQEYIIYYNNFKLINKLIEIHLLQPHEEVDKRLLNKLIKEIKQIGVIKHPIIVDKNSLIVLDGMHRLEALKKLKCKLVPCVLIDYKDERIKLEKWIRKCSIKRKKIKEFSYLYKEKDHEKIKIKSINEKIKKILYEKPFIKFKNLIIYFKNLDFHKNIILIKEIENKISKMNNKVEYITIKDFFKEIEKNENEKLYFGGKLFTKEEVMKIKEIKKLMPIKSTRHVFPTRIFNINVPLEMLKNKEIKKMQESFIKFLSKKKIKLVKQKSPLKNKILEKEIFIFE